MVQLQQGGSSSAQASVDTPNDQIMASRLEFVRAIKRSGYNNPKRECDYIPAMELVGIYAAHATVSKMLAEGKLEAGPAAFLNAAMSLHSFNVWHCCSHSALSQHNEEHEAFENMVTRLSGLLIGFGDGNVSGHKRHHRYTNTVDDPDLYMTSPLAELGKALAANISATQLIPFPGSAYEDFALQVLADTSVYLLCQDKDTRQLGQSLQASFSGATQVFTVVLVLMFGRYPHLKGRGLVGGGESNEIDSFYNTTWRGQGQVDLWMMGEGWHHGHHAVTDVNYTVLPKVGADVESSHPDMKAAFRGNEDLAAMEADSDDMPPCLSKDASEPCQRGWERTLRVRGEVERAVAAGGTPAAVQGLVAALAESAIDNALRVVTTADCALLRHLHQQMGFKDVQVTDPTHPLPLSKWHETVFSARTQELLREQAGSIRQEVAAVANAAGAAVSPSVRISQKSDLKGCYLEFFRALGSVLVDSDKLWKHLENLAGAFPATQAQGTGGTAPEELLARVQRYLESPLPRNSLRPEELKRPVGSPEGMHKLIGNVLGLRPPASRL